MSGINKYQQEEQLFRYLNNEMTEKERNSFEREMQRDAFLAEAVEGLFQEDFQKIIADTDELKEKLQPGHRSKRQFWWYAAASILILIVSGVWLFNIEKDANQVISQNQSKKHEEEELIEIQKLQEKVSPNGFSAIKTDTIELQKDHPALVSKTKQLPIKVTSDSGIQKKKNIRIRGISSYRTQPSTMSFSDSIALFMQRKKELNPQGESQVKEITLFDTAAEAESSISISMKDAEQSGAFSLVDTGPDSSLQEVVVIGYGTQAKKSLTGAVSKMMPDQKASPSVGWENYQAYLDSICQNPQIGVPKERVVVKLKFIVNAQGQLENFEIMRSSNESYNEEAIRIVKQGLNWNPEVENSVYTNAVVKLRLVFKARQ